MHVNVAIRCQFPAASLVQIELQVRQRKLSLQMYKKGFAPTFHLVRTPVLAEVRFE